MTEGIPFTPGTPCWVDVSTTDPAGSRDFYAGLLGWAYRIDPNPDSGHYTYALLDDEPVAGLSGAPAERGQPVVWTLYLTSVNITYTASAVDQLGGRVLYGPVDIPEQGSMVVAADPTGAAIGFWQPSSSWIFRTHVPGAFCWAELNTSDGEAADEFFARMFGYRQQQIGDGVTFDYTTWALGDYTPLGRLLMGPDFPPDTAPHWLPYFAVDPATGTDSAAFRAVHLGGRVRADPFDTGFGRITVIDDPSGATFGLIDPSRLVEAETGAANEDPYDN
ncbi:MAG: VOC family protein [Pseudonocardiaceae bacterium]